MQQASSMVVFTVPSVEKILEPYAQKSYKKYKEKYLGLGLSEERAEEETIKDIKRDFEQGVQGWGI